MKLSTLLTFAFIAAGLYLAYQYIWVPYQAQQAGNQSAILAQQQAEFTAQQKQQDMAAALQRQTQLQMQQNQFAQTDPLGLGFNEFALLGSVAGGVAGFI